jgi:hypothetical protein
MDIAIAVIYDYDVTGLIENARQRESDSSPRLTADEECGPNVKDRPLPFAGLAGHGFRPLHAAIRCVELLDHRYGQV